ncbi:hypothetical protein BTO30_02990 [Domibacillus antri]|uniref:Uncharacterized protein n=1 Tax=Domibacillus antri TaxID=1714264 RepID=A0A1Q8Q8P5_9BACI|nr:hypothetical protein [Domibacillus antri]OLN23719.1 hypothetical protein BTO30_02990 [Domibacillus antri]
MKILHSENGQIVITGDESLLAKIEGENLNEISVDDIRVDADELSKLFEIACARKTVETIGRYSLLKEKYLATYSA